jgi:hypothetical protein
MKWRWLRGAVAIAGLVLLISGRPTLAQDDGLDQSTLDSLRAEVPQGEPGEDDLQEGDDRFGRLVAILGENTTVDIGSGAKLEGVCGGYAYSFDENGVLIDSALGVGNGTPPIDTLDGGPAFTSSNPFKVDTRGTVRYFGFMPRSGEGPKDHSWTIKTSGISLDSGGDPNQSGKNRNEGVVDLADDLPLKFSAKVQVSGRLDSSNIGACVGEGHVEFIGNGLTDPVGLVALALLGGGIFGLLFNARPAHTYKSGGSR